MALKIANKIGVQRQLDVLWDNFRHLLALQFLVGEQIDATDQIAVGAGTLEMRHGLGRVPRGFITLDHASCIILHRSGWTATTISFVTTGYAATNYLRLMVY